MASASPPTCGGNFRHEWNGGGSRGDLLSMPRCFSISVMRARALSIFFAVAGGIAGVSSEVAEFGAVQLRAYSM